MAASMELVVTPAYDFSVVPENTLANVNNLPGLMYRHNFVLALPTLLHPEPVILQLHRGQSFHRLRTALRSTVRLQFEKIEYG